MASGSWGIFLGGEYRHPYPTESASALQLPINPTLERLLPATGGSYQLGWWWPLTIRAHCFSFLFSFSFWEGCLSYIKDFAEEHSSKGGKIEAVSEIGAKRSTANKLFLKSLGCSDTGWDIHHDTCSKLQKWVSFLNQDGHSSRSTYIAPIILGS